MFIHTITHRLHHSKYIGYCSLYTLSINSWSLSERASTQDSFPFTTRQDRSACSSYKLCRHLLGHLHSGLPYRYTPSSSIDQQPDCHMLAILYQELVLVNYVGDRLSFSFRECPSSSCAKSRSVTVIMSAPHWPPSTEPLHVSKSQTQRTHGRLTPVKHQAWFQVKSSPPASQWVHLLKPSGRQSASQLWLQSQPFCFS